MQWINIKQRLPNQNPVIYQIFGPEPNVGYMWKDGFPGKWTIPDDNVETSDWFWLDELAPSDEDVYNELSYVKAELSRTKSALEYLKKENKLLSEKSQSLEKWKSKVIEAMPLYQEVDDKVKSTVFKNIDQTLKEVQKLKDSLAILNSILN
jgi:hypothetical protein